MGQIGSFMRRKVNRFNVENRAQRVLQRDKPIPAPKYPDNIKDMQRTLEVDPTFMDKLNRQDVDLHERLKSVYVTSTDIIKPKPEKDERSTKPLPTDRSYREGVDYSYLETKDIPVGRYSLQQALKFISDNQADAKQWSSQKIADEYKLNQELVENILLHFKTLNVYIPEEKPNEKFLNKFTRNLLPPSKKKTDITDT